MHLTSISLWVPAILDVEMMSQPEGKFGHDWDSAALQGLSTRPLLSSA